MNYACVVIFKKAGKFDGPLTYAINQNLKSVCQVGQTVYVPLRNRSVLGIIIGLSDKFPASVKSRNIKQIEKITNFSLTAKQIELASNIADYYYTSITRSLRLIIPKTIWNGKTEEPKEKYYKLNHQIASDITVRGSLQKEILKTLQKKELREKELVDLTKASKEAIRSLIKKELIEEVIKPIYKKPDYNIFPLKPFCHSLTDSQKTALKKIHSANKPILIHGITGSGKTELYLRVIMDAVKKGRQAILTVPEIALTPQIVDYFKDYFGNYIAIFHSKLSDGQRAEEWWKVKTGYAPLVIGSRSAIFAPAENPGVIILDEEHEWTYKQESAPYYQTHHIADMLAKEYSAKLIFGSATPRLETYYNAVNKQDPIYEYIKISERINKSNLPKINIINLCDEFKQKNFSIFSRILQRKMKERLEKKEQIILFVNQRGAARAVVCRDCGYTEECPNCEVSLKYHRGTGDKNDALLCHYCGYTKAPFLQCPECHSPHIKHVGLGTQRAEEDAKALFPNAKILRADKDTTGGKTGFEEIYKKFKNREYDILIGTQMVAKGLDFENVSLIGLILADIGLHVPDFRSHERLFQLITQVSGRCGRGESTGEVVLQTYQPEHDAIKSAATYEYDNFMQQETKYRKKLSYPPFYGMIKFIAVNSDPKILYEHIKAETEILEDVFKVNNLSFKITSAPAMIPKIANRYYYNILIRAKNPHIIFRHWKPPKYWRVDVDPIHTA